LTHDVIFFFAPPLPDRLGESTTKGGDHKINENDRVSRKRFEYRGNSSLFLPTIFFCTNVMILHHFIINNIIRIIYTSLSWCKWIPNISVQYNIGIDIIVPIYVHVHRKPCIRYVGMYGIHNDGNNIRGGTNKCSARYPYRHCRMRDLSYICVSSPTLLTPPPKTLKSL